MKNTPYNLIVHHTVTPLKQDPDVAEKLINASHKKRHFNLSQRGYHIGYHFIIYHTGEVRRYRNDSEHGNHCREQGMNFKSLGIALQGNFSEDHPTEEQINSLKKLIDELQPMYGIQDENIKPHRFYKATQCYGLNLPDNPLELLNRHWSDEAMDWLAEHDIITQKKDPNYGVTWGELAVVLYRLTKKILEWSRKK